MKSPGPRWVRGVDMKIIYIRPQDVSTTQCMRWVPTTGSKQASKLSSLRLDRTIFHVGNALGKLVPAALLADCEPTDVAHSGKYATSVVVHPSRVHPRPRGRRTCRASTARASNSSAAPSRYKGCKLDPTGRYLCVTRARSWMGPWTSSVPLSAFSAGPCLRSTSYAAANRSHAECGSPGPPACLQSIPVYRNGDPKPPSAPSGLPPRQLRWLPARPTV